MLTTLEGRSPVGTAYIFPPANMYRMLHAQNQLPSLYKPHYIPSSGHYYAPAFLPFSHNSVRRSASSTPSTAIPIPPPVSSHKPSSAASPKSSPVALSTSPKGLTRRTSKSKQVKASLVSTDTKNNTTKAWTSKSITLPEPASKYSFSHDHHLPTPEAEVSSFIADNVNTTLPVTPAAAFAQASTGASTHNAADLFRKVDVVSEISPVSTSSLLSLSRMDSQKNCRGVAMNAELISETKAAPTLRIKSCLRAIPAVMKTRPVPRDGQKFVKTTRLSFDSSGIEKVCLFEKTSPVLDVQTAERYQVEDQSDVQTGSVSSYIALMEIWTLVAHNVPALPSFGTQPVTLDIVKMDVNNRSLVGNILVRNIAFDKSVFLRCTSDNWTTTQDIPAVFANVVSATNSSSLGMDRFTFSVDLNTLSKESTAKEMRLQFAICYRVNGCEHWDSNNGKNYSVEVMRPTKEQFLTATSPSKNIPSYALDWNQSAFSVTGGVAPPTRRHSMRNFTSQNASAGLSRSKSMNFAKSSNPSIAASDFGKDSPAVTSVLETNSHASEPLSTSIENVVSEMSQSAARIIDTPIGSPRTGSPLSSPSLLRVSPSLRSFSTSPSDSMCDSPLSLTPSSNFNSIGDHVASPLLTAETPISPSPFVACTLPEAMLIPVTVDESTKPVTLDNPPRAASQLSVPMTPAQRRESRRVIIARTTTTLIDSIWTQTPNVSSKCH